MFPYSIILLCAFAGYTQTLFWAIPLGTLVLSAYSILPNMRYVRIANGLGHEGRYEAFRYVIMSAGNCALAICSAYGLGYTVSWLGQLA